MKLRYLYRLRPGAQAVEALRAEHRLTRWVWNECVHQYRSGNRPTAASLDKMLTQARRRADWLRAGSSVVQQQEIRNYSAALRQSFTVPGRGRPGYKSAKKNQQVSLNYTRNGFSIKGRRLHLAGGVVVPVVWSRELPEPPTSVRVYEDAAGWWWASFVVDAPETPRQQAPATALGIDWGISTTATTTDPSLDWQFRDVAAQQARGIKRHQRRMALHRDRRDDAGKKAYSRAKKAAARAHKRAAWQRKERARAWAQQVASQHRFVASEKFRPRFLASSTMSRKMHAAAISSLQSELAYAVRRAGGTFVEVPAPYTTMTCSSCGVRAKHRLPLQQRVFVCTSCGFECDRDRNAALNVKQWAGFDPTLDDGRQPGVLSGTPAS